MRVNFRRQWFGPDGVRYRTNDNPHELPDEFKDVLPSSAEVLSKAEEKEVVRAEKAKE